MAAEQSTDVVSPSQIVKGDLIQERCGQGWLRVTEIQVLDDGVLSFYGSGPDTRVTFEEGELVRRRKN